MIFVIHKGAVVGQVSMHSDGFRFIPYSSAIRRSRKAWPTREAAIKGRTKGKMIDLPDIKEALRFAQIDARGGK